MTRLRTESYNLNFEDQTRFNLQGSGVSFHNSNQLRFEKDQGLAVVDIVKPLDLQDVVKVCGLDLGISAQVMLSESLFDELKLSVGSHYEDQEYPLDYSSHPFVLEYFDKSWKISTNDSEVCSLKDFNFNSNSLSVLKRYLYLKIFLNTDNLSEDLILDGFNLEYCIPNPLEVYFSDELNSEGRGVQSVNRNSPKEITAGSLGGYQLLKSLYIPEEKDFSKFKLFWRISGKQEDFTELEIGDNLNTFEEWLKSVQDSYFDPSFFTDPSSSTFLQLKLDNGDGIESSVDCIFITRAHNCPNLILSEELEDSFYEDVNVMINPFSEVSSIQLSEGYNLTSAKVVKSSTSEVLHSFNNLNDLSSLVSQIQSYQVDTGVLFVGNPLRIYTENSLVESLVLVVDDSGSNLPIPPTANKIVKGIRIKPCKVSLNVTDSESSEVVPHFKFNIKGVNRGIGLDKVSTIKTSTFSYNDPLLYDYLEGDEFNVAPLEYYDITVVAEGYHPKTERFYVVNPTNDLSISLEDVDLDLQQKMQTVFDQMTDDTYGMNALKTTVETSISQNAVLLGSIQSPDFGLNSLKSVLGSLNEESLGKLDNLLSLVNTLDSRINVLNILQDSTVGNEALASTLEGIKNTSTSSSSSRVPNIKSS